MSPRTPRTARTVLRRAATAKDPQGMPVLVAAGAFPRMSAAAVAAALARGLQDGGLAAPQRIELPPHDAPAGEVRARLEREGFDSRLHLARAVVVALARLDEPSLAGSAAFEIATRARQAGVPAYAVAAHNALNAFDARMLDLQLVLQARGARSLARAGGELAGLLLSGGR